MEIKNLSIAFWEKAKKKKRGRVLEDPEGNSGGHSLVSEEVPESGARSESRLRSSGEVFSQERFRSFQECHKFFRRRVHDRKKEPNLTSATGLSNRPKADLHPPPDSSFRAYNRALSVSASTGRATTLILIFLFEFVRWKMQVNWSLQMPQAILISLPTKVRSW
ncbi:hypothetical protein VNO77_07823 [Canavalia gladiata]|uniref:Uncharacterized protein n=1 Tax=Canavalia gladiata TaxID=3824 RepID=A0AAN9QWC0_CANGL